MGGFDTLFPKISGKHGDFLHQLQRLKADNQLPEILDLEGKIKLHGMHADILFDLTNSNDHTAFSVRFQSRNRICAPNEDSQGWPIQVAQHQDALKYLKSEVLRVFATHNPGVKVDANFPIIIAGEWIGGRVQKTVGLAQLTTRFVILSVSVNCVWQRDVDYKDLQCPKANIYNVFNCGSMVLKMDTRDLSDNNPVLLEMQRLADQVEACCPFAAHFGVARSRGEGIVWKPGIPAAMADSKCWLKTKGPISGKENRIDPARIAQDRKRNASVDECVKRWVTPRRIDQGFEYLLEMRLGLTRQSLNVYIDWITKDILEEERSEIEQLKKRFSEAEKVVKSKVGYAARHAYLAAMDESGVRPA
jgi:hypothetical protein